MPGVQKVNLRRRYIPPIGVGLGVVEGRVVLAPNDEHQRLVVAKPALPTAIGGNIGPVVEKEIQLDLSLLGPRQEQALIFPEVRVIDLGTRI